MGDIEASLDAAIAAINAPSGNLYDVTIVCTTDDHQAEYWMNKLTNGVCKSSGESNFPMVLAVSEDWSAGGAGNGLGTLYAYTKAVKLAKDKFNEDLEALLKEKKISAALFHTAGKGTRLAPMPASENNNKPGVKLPFSYKTLDGTYQSLSVLEAVVKQTGIYASSRKGRLSVFWGDQVFIPSAAFSYTPSHHIDIMCTLLGETAPTAQEWTDQGLDKYGVIAVINRPDGKSDAAQVEKVSHATATDMLGKLGNIGSVGPSLGSFSVSAEILQALCREFSTELTTKEGKLDTDPHFWMPMTLSEPDYVALMKLKGVEAADSTKHYARMGAMKSSFELGTEMGLFGAVNVGKAACWWDYGQLKLYSKNSLLLLEKNSRDAELLRKFLAVTEHHVNSKLDGVTVDDVSRTFSTKGKKGTIKDSVVSNSQALEFDCDGAIVVNCIAKKIKAGKGSILYNLIDESDDGIVAAEGEVIVSVMDQSGDSMLLKSRMDIDGGKTWKQKLDMNELSFEDVMKKNMNANISEIAKKREESYEKLAASLSI